MRDAADTHDVEPPPSSGWFVLRAFLYALFCGLGTAFAGRRVITAVIQLEELQVELPQISILAIQAARLGWLLAAAVFVLAFGVLALLGAASRSRALRVLGAAFVLALSAVFSLGMIWAAEMPLERARQAAAEESPPPTKKR